MAHTGKHKRALEPQGLNPAEVDRRDGVRMVVQECPPCLRWRSSVPDHVLGNCRFDDLEPELQQLTMYARGAPQWVSLFIRRMSSRSSRLTLGLPGRR